MHIKSDQGLISLYVNYNELVGTKENCNALLYYIKHFRHTDLTFMLFSLFVCCMLFLISFTIFSLKSISVEKKYNYYVLNGVSENLKIQGFVKKNWVTIIGLGQN